jgi:hypothetical protein
MGTALSANSKSMAFPIRQAGLVLASLSGIDAVKANEAFVSITQLLPPSRVRSLFERNDRNPKPLSKSTTVTLNRDRVSCRSAILMSLRKCGAEIGGPERICIPSVRGGAHQSIDVTN